MSWLWNMFAGLSERFDRVSSKPWRPYAGPYFVKALGLVGISLVSVSLLSLMVLGVGITGRQVPTPRHFLYDSGTIKDLEVSPLPNLSIVKIEGWSMSAIREIMSMNFFNADERFLQSRPWFTDAGWTAYSNAVESSNMITNIKARQLDLTLVPLKNARIIQSKVLGKSRVWEVEIPVLLSFTGATRPTYMKRICTLIILQVPTTENVEGLAIAKFVISSYG